MHSTTKAIQAFYNHSHCVFLDRSVDALADEIDSLKKALEKRDRELSRTPKTGKESFCYCENTIRLR